MKDAAPDTIDIGMISHVGGHAFAGNVIVYLPPNHTIPDSKKGERLGETAMKSPLAGRGTWYGRVEPKHVRGILQETVEQGSIISELWRGGMRSRDVAQG